MKPMRSVYSGSRGKYFRIREERGDQLSLAKSVGELERIALENLNRFNKQRIVLFNEIKKKLAYKNEVYTGYVDKHGRNCSYRWSFLDGKLSYEYTDNNTTHNTDFGQKFYELNEIYDIKFFRYLTLRKFVVELLSRYLYANKNFQDSYDQDEVVCFNIEGGIYLFSATYHGWEHLRFTKITNL